MGVYLVKLASNSRLDNSRKHVVHGECTQSTDNVSSKLLQRLSSHGLPALCLLGE